MIFLIILFHPPQGMPHNDVPSNDDKSEIIAMQTYQLALPI
jgi:hypothetical protein